jgi:hypothetical protein
MPTAMTQSHRANAADSQAGQHTQAVADLQATAAALLLRSPRLSVSLILELLDIGDAQFRELSKCNPKIATLLEQRSRGELDLDQPELKICTGCSEWFIPYAGQRCCSDECYRIARISA